MKATQTISQRPIDWRTRCQLAKSILDQREPSEEAGVLAYKALEGHSLEALLARQRVMRGEA